MCVVIWELKGIHSGGLLLERVSFFWKLDSLANQNTVESIADLGEVGFTSSEFNSSFHHAVGLFCDPSLQFQPV